MKIDFYNYPKWLKRFILKKAHRRKFIEEIPWNINLPWCGCLIPDPVMNLKLTVDKKYPDNKRHYFGNYKCIKCGNRILSDIGHYYFSEKTYRALHYNI